MENTGLQKKQINRRQWKIQFWEASPFRRLEEGSMPVRHRKMGK